MMWKLELVKVLVKPVKNLHSLTMKTVLVTKIPRIKFDMGYCAKKNIAGFGEEIHPFHE